MMLSQTDIAFAVVALFILVIFFMIGDNEIVLGAIVVAGIAFVLMRMKQRTMSMGEY